MMRFHIEPSHAQIIDIAVEDAHEYDEIMSPLLERVRAREVEKTEEQNLADLEARLDALDALSAELEAREGAWRAALKRWRLPENILAEDTVYADETKPHPFWEAFMSEYAPDEFDPFGKGKKLTRADAHYIHQRWKRERDAALEDRQSKRMAKLMQSGVMDRDAAAYALREEDRMWEAEMDNVIAQGRQAALRNAPYVAGASKVALSWRSKGAKLPGVRFRRNGHLPAGSKLVAWFKNLCGDKAPKRVAETAARMSGPARRWQKDLSDYQTWNRQAEFR